MNVVDQSGILGIMMSQSHEATVNGNGISNGQARTPFLIGVTGGTSAGKTSVCRKIMESLKETSGKVALVSQDDFYKPLSEDELSQAMKSQYNFDHPDAFDKKLMYRNLADIAQGKQVKMPKYDFKTHSRMEDGWTELESCDVILFEGILVFYHKEIRDLFNMKLFVDTDADTRLSRRVLRDISERGRDLESVLHQYITFVKPAFEEFCQPTKKYADVIIPRGHENTVAIDLIVQHIQDILNGQMRRRQNGETVPNGVCKKPHVNGFTPGYSKPEVPSAASRPH